VLFEFLENANRISKDDAVNSISEMYKRILSFGTVITYVVPMLLASIAYDLKTKIIIIKKTIDSLGIG
jgi:hypothetical protein